MSDEFPQLREDTLAALAMFQAEQIQKAEELKSGKIGKVDEDWQLSQFWYDDATSRTLVDESIAAALVSPKRPAWIACVSSPTLVQFFHEHDAYKSGDVRLRLFEFDARFGIKYPDEFVPYDYKNPSSLPPEMLGTFDVVVADPPFLAPECLIKTAQSIRLLGKKDARIILCTGAIMEDLARRLLGMHPTEFEPRHANNLANNFACYANYQTLTFKSLPGK